jgi:sugar lactone lactonase YvrE
MLFRTLIATLILGTAARASEPVTVATYPSGNFLENLAGTPAGELLITSYTAKRLLAWRGDGAPRTFADLPAHPVGILARQNDVIVSAHAVPFTAGPAFLKSNRLLVLDTRGKLLRAVPAPDARFLNGLVELPSGVVLAADSIAGRIWRFDPASGRLRPWLDHPSLAADPRRPQLPGANGLKLRDGWLYVSNSVQGTLSRVRLDGELPAGAPELVARTGAIDDFAFLPDGSVAAATHGDKLIRIAADGSISEILTDGCDGCTSVALDRRSGRLIVLTTGKLLEGGKGTAKILSVAAP